MNVFAAVAVFACLALAVSADDYNKDYKPGFRRTKNAIVARYNNAERQEAVNDKAPYVGSGTGTEKYDGVPGTDLDFGYYRPYDRYDRHDGYGYDRYDRYDRRYGYDRYDDDRYYGYGRYGYDHYDGPYGYDRRY